MRYLFYHGRVCEPVVQNIEALLAAAYRDGEEVTLCLASHGGDVNAGIGLYNFISMLPIPVHTHAAGICASITVTIMLAGKRRTAAPLSVFSLHAATYSEGPLAGQVAPNTDLISQPFREVLGWTDDEISARFGLDDFRFKPDLACELGLTMSVSDLKLGPADQIIPVRIP